VSARRVAWLLAAGLAVIAFAIWLSSRRHLERDMAAGALVLPGLHQDVNAVTTVTLRKGDGTHATLLKDGSVWRVQERGWTADVGKVRKLLLDLGALNIVEEKTRLPANYPQLGVEDVSSPKATGTRVDIAAPGRTWAIIIGKPSGGKSGYVRVATAPQSLLPRVGSITRCSMSPWRASARSRSIPFPASASPSPATRRSRPTLP